jgi:hypothetical protein
MNAPPRAVTINGNAKPVSTSPRLTTLY